MKRLPLTSLLLAIILMGCSHKAATEKAWNGAHTLSSPGGTLAHNWAQV